MTEEDIIEAYDYHQQPGIWWMCNRNNPIALALKRLGFDYSVNYRAVGTRRRAATDDGLDYFIAVHVVDLPDEAASFMRRFGYSLGGKETKKSFEARKRFRKTSSDHKVPVKPHKLGKRVEPFEFKLRLD